MFRIKSILLGALAVLVVCIVMPTVASADNYVLCKEVGKGKGSYKNAECKTPETEGPWEKVLIEEGKSYTIKGESGASRLESTYGTVECAGDTVTGNFKAEGKSAMTITFEDCVDVSSPICNIPAMKFVVKDKLVGAVGSVEDEITLESGSEVTVECGEAIVKDKLKGHEKCEMPEGDKMKLVHDIVCKLPTSEEEVTEKELLKFRGTEAIEVPPYFWAVN